MAPTSASDIPTLSLLYKLKKLGPSKLGPVPGASPVHNDRVGLFRGDITTLSTDAIVNAANTSLRGGGGVDGAIHRAAGPGLLKECAALGGCATGAAKITAAHALPCRRVIHAVGPVYDDLRPGRIEELLRGCYRSSLELAVRHGLRSLAFSAISTGVYGYPSMDAAVVACDTIKKFLDEQDGGKTLEKVVIVTFEEKDVQAYNHVLPRFFPPSSEISDDQRQAAEDEAAEAEAKASQLPSVPTTDPADTEHAPKKQKQKSEE